MKVSAWNKANEGKRVQSAVANQNSVSCFLMEFEKLQNNNKLVHSIVKHRWRPPPHEWYKINIDGAFDSSSRTGGWGFVARNMKGEALLSGAGNICHVASAIYAEAIPALRSVQHAAHLGIQRLFWRLMQQCSQLPSIHEKLTEVLLVV